MAKKQELNKMPPFLLFVVSFSLFVFFAGCKKDSCVEKCEENTIINYPSKIQISIDNRISLNLIYVKPGTFRMGRDAAFFEKYPFNSNTDNLSYPPSLVTITKGFYIGESNVNCEHIKHFLENTNKELRNKYVNTAVSNQFRQFDCDDTIKILCPITDAVGTISWEGATEYCKWLSHLSGMNFRLPSEAEWEFSARGNGNEYDSIWEHIGYPTPSPTTPTGICDMANGFLGNWCSDYFDDYTSISKLNPKGPLVPPTKYKVNGKAARVIRRPLFSIVRREFGYDTTDAGIYGFRIVLDEESIRNCPCPAILRNPADDKTSAEN